MSHIHFTLEQRIMLEGFLDIHRPMRLIRQELERNPASIYREIRRNSLTRAEQAEATTLPKNKYHYSGKIAQQKASIRRFQANQCHRILGKDMGLLEMSIAKDIRRKWSPEQIAGCYGRFGIKIQGKKHKVNISTQTIYNWIYSYKPELIVHLRRKNRRKRAKQSALLLQRQLDRQSTNGIDLRPLVTKYRGRIGDFEADTILGAGHGKTGRVGTLVDRRSKYLIAFLIPASVTGEGLSRYFAKAVEEALSCRIKPHYIRSITFDNGAENSAVLGLEESLNCKVYFAHPYCSGERGTNENTNGLLRQYFRKGMDFSTITQEELDRVVSEINNRPRKCLHWKTPVGKMRQNDAIIPRYVSCNSN